MIAGIGGAFLFTNDAKRLAAWYRDSLGIESASNGDQCGSVYATFDYRDLDNPDIVRTTAWSIIHTDEDLTGKPRTGQINYRVTDMAAVLKHLADKGVALDKTEDYSYGKFAWLMDPDGNKVELWEAADE
jgi:catechol 2,3-dioxygenase-like lactoylglutathione lyase family enzyme